MAPDLPDVTSNNPTTICSSIKSNLSDALDKVCEHVSFTDVTRMTSREGVGSRFTIIGFKDKTNFNASIKVHRKERAKNLISFRLSDGESFDEKLNGNSAGKQVEEIITSILKDIADKNSGVKLSPNNPKSF